MVFTNRLYLFCLIKPRNFNEMPLNILFVAIKDLSPDLLKLIQMIQELKIDFNLRRSTYRDSQLLQDHSWLPPLKLRYFYLVLSFIFHDEIFCIELSKLEEPYFEVKLKIYELDPLSNFDKLFQNIFQKIFNKFKVNFDPLNFGARTIKFSQ